jgi:acyl carrier protein
MAQHSAAPITETEKVVARIWADVLECEIETVGLDDDFVDLGGSSLEAMVCAVRVQKTFGVRLPVNALIIGEGTLRKIAGRIDTLKSHS